MCILKVEQFLTKQMLFLSVWFIMHVGLLEKMV